MASYSFSLEPTPPFRLDLTAWILCRRPDNLVDRWDGQVYRRVLVLNDKPVEIEVTQVSAPDAPRLKVILNGAGADPGLEPLASAALERLLGIRIDLSEFYRFAESRADLKYLADRFQGSKPPRFPTYFETLANAIACQQLSLTVGIRLLNRLSQAYGQSLRTEAGVFYSFPRPEDLAGAQVEDLRQIGYSNQKGRYLIGLAQAIADRQLNLDEIEILEDSAAIEQLRSIKGVGRWTAEYFLLRGLGRTHIFPGDDVGARNHLQRWLGLPDRLDYTSVHQTLADWSGYGGLVYFHLLLKSLAETGNILEFE
ncbi:MAG: hypothetical protein M5U05_07765 [Anaerolineales bacterium]|nr:hypothetical protein [Anaerolineales bacterium]